MKAKPTNRSKNSQKFHKCVFQNLSLQTLPCFVISDSTGKKIIFTDGTPGASSFFNDNAHPRYAFSPNDKHRYWLTGQSQPLPFFMWYQFKTPVRDAFKMSFEPRPDNLKLAKRQTPKSFQFIGSNDIPCSESSDWSVICSALYSESVESTEEVRGCQAPVHHSKYRCLGIKILAIHSHKDASLSHMMMWSKSPVGMLQKPFMSHFLDFNRIRLPTPKLHTAYGPTAYCLTRYIVSRFS